MTTRSNPLLVIRPSWRSVCRPVVLTETEFGLAGLGGSQLHPRSEVGSVVSAIFAPELRHNLFVLDRHDRLLLRLRAGVYPLEMLDKFVVALDVPVTEFPGIVTRPQPGHVPVFRGTLTDREGVVTPAEFDEEHPGLLSERDFTSGNSRVFTIFLTVMAVIVVIGFALVVLGLVLFGPTENPRF